MNDRREPPLRARVAVSEELQGALVDLLDLTLIGAQLRWVAAGPQAHAIAVESHLEPVPTRRIADRDALYELATRIRETAAHIALSAELAGPLDPQSARLLAELGSS